MDRKTPHWIAALLLGTLNLVLALWGTALLVQIWGQIQAAAVDKVETIDVSLWLLPTIKVDGGVAELILAIAVGLVGSTIATLLAVAKHMQGEADFDRRYGWWYIARPVWGALLAGIAYFLLVAGLVTGLSDEVALKPAGIAVVGGLTGLYSQLVLEKLLEVAKILFSTQAADIERTRRQAQELQATLADIESSAQLSNDTKTALISKVLGTGS